jgi:hypothetical protein
MDPQTVDGMTREQVRYNIYAFGQDLTRALQKRDRARTPHMRAHWVKKGEDAQQALANNQRRLQAFTDDEP